MSRHRLPVLIILCMLPVLLLFGCTTARVDCGVGLDNTAMFSYNVHFYREDAESAQWLKIVGIVNTIERHWFNAGFETDIENTDNEIELTAVMKDTQRSREKAFGALLEMMQSDASAFTKVSGDYSESYFNDEYYLSAECDFTGVIPTQNMDCLPYNIEADVLDILSKSSIEINISLPGEVVEASGEKTEGGCKITAGFSEPVEIFIRTRLNNDDNIAEYGNMLDTRDLSRKLVVGAGIAAALLFITFIVAVLLLIRAARRNKLSEGLKNIVSEAPVEIPSQIDNE